MPKEKTNQYIKDGVLHIVYKDKEDISDEIISFANAYEGYIAGRIGFNLPLEAMIKHDAKHPFVKECLKDNVKYVIVYKKGDVLTMNHELCHAKYGMDENYRKDVATLWESLPDKYKKNVKEMLKRMKYPEKDNIILDEFQAYYFTEKGLFGKFI